MTFYVSDNARRRPLIAPFFNLYDSVPSGKLNCAGLRQVAGIKRHFGSCRIAVAGFISTGPCPARCDGGYAFWRANN